MTNSQYYGSLTAPTKFAPHVDYGLLSAQNPAALSQIIGAGFNPLRGKINVLRGLDVQADSHNHNFCMATCASSYGPNIDNDEAAPITNQESVDVVISKSAKVYGPNTAQNRRHIFMAPLSSDDYSNNRTFSFRRGATNLQMVRPTKQSTALYDIFATGFGAQAAPPPSQHIDIIQGVFEDYRSTRDSSRISSADKKRLSDYMDLISDIQRGLASDQSGTPPMCTTPTQQAESSVDLLVQNQFRILAAAMACDMTRVASVTLGMSQGYGTRHGEHHGVFGGPSGFLGDIAKSGDRVAEFLKILNGISDGTGTLLDNSLVYWGMQYAVAQIDDQHTVDDFAVMLAGGAAGQMRTGYFVDYRHDSLAVHEQRDQRLGIPLNNLLVTLMNCMGLSSADYETVAGAGYGRYIDSYASEVKRPNIQSWMTTAGRRTALPFLYTGPSRG